ncbi:hypothetical protein GCM10023189_35200 [Nibrella saemangeumensis]|uniref:Response regulatory domain-containing protein n=1 Tax=Nibrella saemangeumensis TaxID=1084526 RepID=A0ABP8N5L6_9BACT
MFDFLVEDYLNHQEVSISFSHILLDLDMGYQPAIDIICLLRRHRLTRHIPITVYSQYQSACIVRRVEESGVDAYLVRSFSWAYMARVFREIHLRVSESGESDGPSGYKKRLAA